MDLSKALSRPGYVRATLQAGRAASLRIIPLDKDGNPRDQPVTLHGPFKVEFWKRAPRT